MQPVMGGVATFGDLWLDKVGQGYKFVALDGGLGSAPSSNFQVKPATSDHLAFAVQPHNAVAGAFLSPAVTVQVLDQYGNLVTGDTSMVTVALSANPVAGTLSGVLTAQAIGGVATFNKLWVNKVGSGYSLTAGDNTLGAAYSGGFAITPAGGDQPVL